MARPEERGLKYFSFDIDFFDDEKIEAISGEFGIKGEITVVKLLCAVYRNGYFIEWTEMLKMKLLRNLPSISSDLLDQIINRLVKWDFFDENLFDSVKILTSRGIQKRYFEAVKRRKQATDYPYLLINVCNNCTSSNINANINPQSKGNESKGEISPSNAHDQGEFPPSNVFDKPIADCYNALSSNNSWIEVFVMNIRSSGNKEFTLDMFYKYLKLYFAELQNRGIISKSPADAMSHFASWLKIELKKQEDDKRRTSTFSPTATNPRGKDVRGEAKAATDMQSGGTPQKDYSSRF